VFVADGAIAIAPTERLAMPSVSAVHAAPLVVVFHAPPPAAPTIAVPAVDGCVAAAVMRPAPFVGPRFVHTVPPIESAATF